MATCGEDLDWGSTPRLRFRQSAVCLQSCLHWPREPALYVIRVTWRFSGLTVAVLHLHRPLLLAAVRHHVLRHLAATNYLRVQEVGISSPRLGPTLEFMVGVLGLAEAEAARAALANTTASMEALAAEYETAHPGSTAAAANPLSAAALVASSVTAPAAESVSDDADDNSESDAAHERNLILAGVLGGGALFFFYAGTVLPAPAPHAAPRRAAHESRGSHCRQDRAAVFARVAGEGGRVGTMLANRFDRFD